MTTIHARQIQLTKIIMMMMMIMMMIIIIIIIIIIIHTFMQGVYSLFVFGATAPSGPGPPHSRGF